MATKNLPRGPQDTMEGKRFTLDDSCNMEEALGHVTESKRPRPTQQGLNSNTNSSMSAADRDQMRSGDPYAIEREASKSVRDRATKVAYE